METETVKTPEQIAENLWRKRSAENWKDGGLEKPIWIHGCTVGIEHACNSHYELLNALKNLLPLAEDGYKHHSNGCHEEFLKEDRTSLYEAREAIRKATS